MDNNGLDQFLKIFGVFGILVTICAIVIGVFLFINGWDIGAFSVGPIELVPDNPTEPTQKIGVVQTQEDASQTPMSPPILPSNTIPTIVVQTPTKTLTYTPIPSATHTTIPSSTPTETLIPTLSFTPIPTPFTQTVNVPHTGSYGFYLEISSQLQAGTNFQLSYSLLSGDPGQFSFRFCKSGFFKTCIISLDGQGSYSNSFYIDETGKYLVEFYYRALGNTSSVPVQVTLSHGLWSIVEK